MYFLKQNLLVKILSTQISKIKLECSLGWTYPSNQSNYILASLSIAKVNQSIVVIVFNWKHWANWFIDFCCCVWSSCIVSHSRKNSESVSELFGVDHILCILGDHHKALSNKHGNFISQSYVLYEMSSWSILHTCMEAIPACLRKIDVTWCLALLKNRSN